MTIAVVAELANKKTEWEGFKRIQMGAQNGLRSIDFSDVEWLGFGAAISVNWEISQKFFAAPALTLFSRWVAPGYNVSRNREVHSTCGRTATTHSMLR